MTTKTKTRRRREVLSDDLYYDDCYVGRLTWTEYNALDIMLRLGGKCIANYDLAEIIGVNPSTITRMMYSMHIMGLIDRRFENADNDSSVQLYGQYYVYNVTDFGQEVFDEADQHLLDVVDGNIIPMSRRRAIFLKSIESNPSPAT